MSEYAPPPPNLAKPGNGEGSIRIGAYTISICPHGGYWMEHESGEGAQFRTDDVERLINDFYKENF